MDGQRFDEIAKALAVGASRRRVLGGLTGGLAAALGLGRRIGAQGSGEANDACFSGADCQSGVCDRPQGRRRGKCVGAATCANAVLSGGPEATDPVSVDDDLEVRLNGVTVFNDTDGFANDHPPIPLGPTNNGDQLRVIATNSSFNCGAESLSPLYLHCPATGAVQVLDADGFPEELDQPCGEVFYDTTFTVAL